MRADLSAVIGLGMIIASVALIVVSAITTIHSFADAYTIAVIAWGCSFVGTGFLFDMIYQLLREMVKALDNMNSPDDEDENIV